MRWRRASRGPGADEDRTKEFDLSDGNSDVDEKEVRTLEVSEDDVPEEYLDKEVGRSNFWIFHREPLNSCYYAVGFVGLR
jgi:hypothetical protein